MSGNSDDSAVKAVALEALKLVRDGDKVGLGSGRASNAFIQALGEKFRAGLQITGVPTSEASDKLAREYGIPIIELTDGVELDFTVDGADEVAPNLDLIKGWGGALVRERIVAEASRRQIILVGEEKLVSRLGERGRIPVEVIPLAAGFVTGRLRTLNFHAEIRTGKTGPFVTDNSNWILDCRPSAPLSETETRRLNAAILDVAGVVDTGMFLGTAERVLIGKRDGSVEVKISSR